MLRHQVDNAAAPNMDHGMRLQAYPEPGSAVWHAYAGAALRGVGSPRTLDAPILGDGGRQARGGCGGEKACRSIAERRRALPERRNDAFGRRGRGGKVDEPANGWFTERSIVAGESCCGGVAGPSPVGCTYYATLSRLCHCSVSGSWSACQGMHTVVHRCVSARGSTRYKPTRCAVWASSMCHKQAAMMRHSGCDDPGIRPRSRAWVVSHTRVWVTSCW
ncbi:hypothetical protein M3J07_012576 [Ascochyta lentis]